MPPQRIDAGEWAAVAESPAATGSARRGTADPDAALDVPVDVEEIASHDVDHAVVNHAERTGANLLVGEWRSERFHGELLGRDVDRYIEHAPCDLAFVRDRGLATVGDDDLADGEPYDPLEVLVAGALAREHGARIRFVYALAAGATDEQGDAITAHHDRLAELCTVPTERTVLRTDDRETALLETADGADLVVVSTSAHNRLYDVVVGSLSDRLAVDLDCTVLLVHSRQPRRHTSLRHLIERVAY